MRGLASGTRFSCAFLHNYYLPHTFHTYACYTCLLPILSLSSPVSSLSLHTCSCLYIIYGHGQDPTWGPVPSLCLPPGLPATPRWNFFLLLLPVSPSSSLLPPYTIELYFLHSLYSPTLWEGRSWRNRGCTFPSLSLPASSLFPSLSPGWMGGTGSLEGPTFPSPSAPSSPPLMLPYSGRPSLCLSSINIGRRGGWKGAGGEEEGEGEGEGEHTTQTYAYLCSISPSLPPFPILLFSHISPILSSPLSQAPGQWGQGHRRLPERRKEEKE